MKITEMFKTDDRCCVDYDAMKIDRSDTPNHNYITVFMYKRMYWQSKYVPGKFRYCYLASSNLI